ncbi:MAG TPA: hypothetical protein PLV49_06575 [Methanothrix soehngenii]|nr:hypothetical protein [Methanothrix soehngenii]
MLLALAYQLSGIDILDPGRSYIAPEQNIIALCGHYMSPALDRYLAAAFDGELRRFAGIGIFSEIPGVSFYLYWILFCIGD